MAYIAIDFGSSNTGAVINTASGKEYCPSELIYVHAQDGINASTKQPTDFWIKKSLLDKGLNDISVDDIHVYSCVFYEEDIYKKDANFIWCRNQMRKLYESSESNPNLEDWVRFKYPKMVLYNATNASDATITGSNKLNYPLSKILHIFFLVLKRECLKKANDANLILSESDISWAITVPGLAIWQQDAVQVIKDVVRPILGQNVTFLSEPECALIGINISGNASLDFSKDRRSLVVDLGGGTADICVMEETQHDDGTMTFDEVKSTQEGQDATTSKKSGGNDIENNFIVFFINYLMKGCEIDDSQTLIYRDFLSEKPAGAFEFQDKYLDLILSDKILDDEVPFNPGRIFVDWLKTHYPKSARKRDEYGDFCLNGKELREKVTEPVYKTILDALNINLKTLSDKKTKLDVLYFAGGLSLDKNLNKRIKQLAAEKFKDIKFKEASDGSVIGAVQRGAIHLLVNKNTLVRRMSRRAFYHNFAIKYSGSIEELKAEFRSIIRRNYSRLTKMILSNEKVEAILNKNWQNISIDYSTGIVSYLNPICRKFAPVNTAQEIDIAPINEGEQTGADVNVYSSDDNDLIFKNQSLTNEGEISYDFGYNWSSAKLVFDPSSNAVEGTAIFYLEDSNGKKLEEITINNVSKRGI